MGEGNPDKLLQPGSLTWYSLTRALLVSENGSQMSKEED
jgi:hypothetical protein